MKKNLSFYLLLLTAFLIFFMAVTCVFPPAERVDFNLRINEIECLLKGVNPFDIWNEEVRLHPYVSNIPKQPVPEDFTKMVNAYAPWEYSYMMAFALLPRGVAWFVYSLLMLLSCFFLIKITRSFLDDTFDEDDKKIISLVPFIVVSYLLWSNVSVGNFVVFVLLFSILTARFLSQGNQVVAGVCWALAMVKPQSAILLAIPLLIRKKFFACFIAVAVCLGASLLPSYLCKTSLIELLIQGPAANAELFYGSGTWPLIFCGYFSNLIDILIGLFIGILLCVFMTWRLRDENDYLIFIMPSLVVASSWTYTQVYGHAICYLLVYAILKDLLKNPSSKMLRILFVSSLFVLSRGFLAWRGLCAYMGVNFPLSEYAFRSIDSLNTTVTLVIALVYVIFKTKNQKQFKLI